VWDRIWTPSQWEDVLAIIDVDGRRSQQDWLPHPSSQCLTTAAHAKSGKESHGATTSVRSWVLIPRAGERIVRGHTHETVVIVVAKPKGDVWA
jgi:hypothetical protein